MIGAKHISALVRRVGRTALPPTDQQLESLRAHTIPSRLASR
jgi:hypothetical protein